MTLKLHPFDTLSVTFRGGCAFFRGMRGECDDVRVVVDANGMPVWELRLDGLWVPMVPAEVRYSQPQPALPPSPSKQPAGSTKPSSSPSSASA